MKTFNLLKPVSAVLLTSLIAFTVGCGYSKKIAPPTAGSTPTMALLNPASVTADSATFSLEVDGANFASRAVVNFNGAAMTTTFVDSTRLEATIPASALLNAGVVRVTVTNPAVAGGIYGGGTLAETSSATAFTIN